MSIFIDANEARIQTKLATQDKLLELFDEVFKDINTTAMRGYNSITVRGIMNIYNKYIQKNTHYKENALDTGSHNICEVGWDDFIKYLTHTFTELGYTVTQDKIYDNITYSISW